MFKRKVKISEQIFIPLFLSRCPLGLVFKLGTRTMLTVECMTLLATNSHWLKFYDRISSYIDFSIAFDQDSLLFKYSAEGGPSA